MGIARLNLMKDNNILSRWDNGFFSQTASSNNPSAFHCLNISTALVTGLSATALVVGLFASLGFITLGFAPAGLLIPGAFGLGVGAAMFVASLEDEDGCPSPGVG